MTLCQSLTGRPCTQSHTLCIETVDPFLIFSLAPWQGDGTMFRKAVIQLYAVKSNYEVDVGEKSELVSRGH